MDNLMTEYPNGGQFDWNSVVYCPCNINVQMPEIIDKICDGIFYGNLKDEVSEIYAKLADSKLHERVFSICDSHSLINAELENFIGDFYGIGHDFPVWLQRSVDNESVSKQAKRIMIVSERPLRKEPKECQVGKPIGGDFGMTASTPFGVHVPMNSANNPNVRFLLERLLLKDAIVYMTDCIKHYYVEYPGRNEKKKYLDKHEEVYGRILSFEEEMFQPDVILTFGEIALKHVMGLNRSRFCENVVPAHPMIQKFKILPLVHASNRTSGAIAKVLVAKCACKNGRCTREFVQEEYYGSVVAQIFNI